ncbi:MAG: ATP-binding protein [Flavobacteriales bacterium]|nr:ATP-binding protein [Flavobacteriales bacterium]
MRNRIASDLHDEVGSSLSAITIGSQLAKQLGNCEDQRMQVLLSRIGSTSSESLRSMSDIVWAIDPKNDQGEALVKRMRRIANELLESKGVEVSFIVTGGVEELKLPMNARKDLLLIYKEAVHNASKYAEARNVSIHLSRAHGTLSLSVKDDGKGFDHALHPDGHGLGSMQRRGTTLGSMVLIESMMGEGTRISIQVHLTRIRD